MQNPALEAPPSTQRRMPTRAVDPIAHLLQAALDPDVDVGQLRSLCDQHEGQSVAMASIPGMGRN